MRVCVRERERLCNEEGRGSGAILRSSVRDTKVRVRGFHRRSQ